MLDNNNIPFDIFCRECQNYDEYKIAVSWIQAFYRGTITRRNLKFDRIKDTMMKNTLDAFIPPELIHIIISYCAPPLYSRDFLIL